MNKELPRCGRCDGVRFFRIARMQDAAAAAGERDHLVFRVRPVRLLDDSSEVTPLGHFETLVCRSCGWTAWYAQEWKSPPTKTQPQACLDCDRTTPQVTLPAVEHALFGFERARITRGLLGREGFLSHRICTLCDRASWIGADYAHLDRTHFVAYQLKTELDRPCLSCGATAAIVDDMIVEYDGPEIALAVRPTKFLWLIPLHEYVGHFAIRLCRPCGALEWYARDFERLAHDPAAGVFAIGDTPQTASVGGPYR